MPDTITPASTPGGDMSGGRKRGATVKQMKRMLKKAGLKTTGRKSALTRRAKKAHLQMGGTDDEVVEGGRRRRRGGNTGKLSLY